MEKNSMDLIDSSDEGERTPVEEEPDETLPIEVRAQQNSTKSLRSIQYHPDTIHNQTQSSSSELLSSTTPAIVNLFSGIVFDSARVEKGRTISAGKAKIASSVKLPTTFRDYIMVRKEHQADVSYNYPADLKLICRYSGAAVAADRSCGDVMIMMAGYTGAGKSTTINRLFEDDGLCTTAMSKSGTRSVFEVRVKLTIKRSNYKPSIDTSLVFVDIPGALDVEEKLREPNQAIVKKYLGTTPSLTSRPTKILDELDGFASHKKSSSRVAKVVTKKLLTIRGGSQEPNKGGSQKFRKVFPNMILLTVNANDNRMVGSDSDLSKTLKSLKELQVIDLNRLNLLVVVTHAGCLGKRKYAEKTERICKDIRNLLVDVFAEQRLMDTQVIFIENEPEEYDLEKQEDSDFYMLPDETLSHFNLIQAMTDKFQANGDLLGMLTCGWYFGKKSSEEKGKVDLTETMTYKNLGNKDEDIENKAQKIATKEADKIERIKLQLARELPLLYIGHGFCPSTEIRKCNSVITHGKTQPVVFRKSHEKFITHSQFRPIEVQESIFERLTQGTMEAYEAGRAASYGFEPDMHFKMNKSVRSFGKWESESDVSNYGNKVVSFLFERRIVCLQIEDPKRHLNADLLTALNNLPMELNPTEPMKRAYLDFFAEWGTHFVRESCMGGSIKVTAKIPSSVSNDPNYDSKMLSDLRNQFDLCEKDKPNTSESAFDAEYSDFALKICGGTPPSVTLLSDLTPEIYQEWIQTIESHPAELDHCMKLEPYYQMIDGPQRAALQLATAQYLQCDTAVLSLTRENVSNVICDSAMNDEHKEYYYEHSLLVRVLLGVVLVLTSPIWGPFVAAQEAYVRIKKCLRKSLKQP